MTYANGSISDIGIPAIDRTGRLCRRGLRVSFQVFEVIVQHLISRFQGSIQLAGFFVRTIKYFIYDIYDGIGCGV